jgi:hypothetical protein
VVNDTYLKGTIRIQSRRLSLLKDTCFLLRHLRNRHTGAIHGLLARALVNAGGCLPNPSLAS